MHSQTIHLQFRKLILTLLLFTFTSGIYGANSKIGAIKREAVIREIAKSINDNYFDAKKAHEISAALIAHLKSGKYSDISDSNQLANTLTEILSKYDRHFNVRFANGQSQQKRMQRTRITGEHDDPYEQDRRGNFGYSEVKVLPGNIGYIKLDQFAPIESALETATSALEFVKNTDAVIFDTQITACEHPQ